MRNADKYILKLLPDTRKGDAPSSDSPSPTFSDNSAFANGLPTPQTTYQLSQQTSPVDAQFPPQSAFPSFGNFSDRFSFGTSAFDASPPLACNTQTSNDASSTNGLSDEVAVLQPTPTSAESFTPNQSPRLMDLLLPCTDLSVFPPEYGPQQATASLQRGEVPVQQQYDAFPVDEDVEEVLREPPRTGHSVIPLPSPAHSSSSSSSSGSVPDFFASMFGQPRMLPGSAEMLALRFDRQTCGILSIKDGPTENPWRYFVWPLAQESPALYHAVNALTAFHASKEEPGLRVEGMRHMTRSLRRLGGEMAQKRIQTALATTLVLAFTDSWDRHISTGTQHLRGAKALIDELFREIQQSGQNGMDFPGAKFLCNTWVYMDVLARLTSVNSDECDEFEEVLAGPGSSWVSSNEIDPLMGCARTLFPMIGHVANLVRRAYRSSRNSLTTISQATDLKAAIEKWEAPSIAERPEDPTSEVSHSFETAEAYRWATVLYLQQAVPEIATWASEDLANKVLTKLAVVPVSSRATIVHIYPLLAAGCEVVSEEERKWVEERWTSMMQRMHIGNLDRCKDVTKEVWHRRDVYEANKLRLRHERAASRLQIGSGIASLQRMGSSQEETMSSGDLHDLLGRQFPRRNSSRRESFDIAKEDDSEKNVKGRLHWVGVMKDWDWESKSTHTFARFS